MMFERWKKETTAETLLDMTQVWKRNCNGVKKGIKFTDLKNKTKKKKTKKNNKKTICWFVIQYVFNNNVLNDKTCNE